MTQSGSRLSADFSNRFRVVRPITAKRSVSGANQQRGTNCKHCSHVVIINLVWHKVKLCRGLMHEVVAIWVQRNHSQTLLRGQVSKSEATSRSQLNSTCYFNKHATEWITTWATTVQHTSIFQVSPEDTLLPRSHGQLAPHSQVAPPIAFLWRSLRTLNKFMTDTYTDRSGRRSKRMMRRRRSSSSLFSRDYVRLRSSQIGLSKNL